MTYCRGVSCPASALGTGPGPEGNGKASASGVRLREERERESARDKERRATGEKRSKRGGILVNERRHETKRKGKP